MTNLVVPQVADLTKLQIDTVERWHREPIDSPYEGFEALVCKQHEYNYQLWHQEDIARSPTVTDEEIANVKRAIDKLNQARNDMIEKVDDALTEHGQLSSCQCQNFLDLLFADEIRILLWQAQQ